MVRMHTRHDPWMVRRNTRERRTCLRRKERLLLTKQLVGETERWRLGVIPPRDLRHKSGNCAENRSNRGAATFYEFGPGTAALQQN